MKPIILCVVLLITHLNLAAQAVKHFNADSTEISEAIFSAYIDTRKYLAIQGDSANHKQLILRTQEGKIEHYQKFKEAIENQTGQKLSKVAPTVIIYYPGKDKCNTTGIATSSTVKTWHKELAKGIFKAAKTTPIYICKDKENIDNKRDGVLPWQNDPDHLIEKTFFKHHYPCGSFVVIDPYGNYISYLGEFMKEQVWEHLKRAKNYQNRRSKSL